MYGLVGTFYLKALLEDYDFPNSDGDEMLKSLERVMRIKRE